MSLLLRQSYPAQQVGVARVGADIVERRVKFDFIEIIASWRRWRGRRDSNPRPLP